MINNHLQKKSRKELIILGSTGSIGNNTLDVIKNNLDKFKIIALTANDNAQKLADQINEFEPDFAVISNEKKFPELKKLVKNKTTKLLAGNDEILNISKIKCDIVMSAIVGFAGMVPTLNAIKAGSNIALANKESLVCAGNFLIEEAKKSKIKIIPVDSEHNAIFQIFENKNVRNIEDIILTASGGPFFNKEIDFKKIKVKEALKHPNWKMGAKISIDSATMMNKGLEMIEAFHLFPIQKNQIKIIIHPQSIIHGIVNYKDGSSLAMMSLPDMRTPISHALSYPKRIAIEHKKLNLAEIQNLTFFESDEKKFPAIKLCRDSLLQGGNAPTILNAANEIAVKKFLDEEISFDKITEIIDKTLSKIEFTNPQSIDEIIDFDRRARKFAQSCK